MHNSIREEFAAALVKHAEGAEARRRSRGRHDPRARSPTRARLTAMSKVLDDARKTGAKIEPAASASAREGNFFAPTRAAPTCRSKPTCSTTSRFGPIALIRGFDKLEEAIAEANRLPFGLAGYAFTKSFANVHLLSPATAKSACCVDQPARYTPTPEMPFGGVKDSATGSERRHRKRWKRIWSRRPSR